MASEWPHEIEAADIGTTPVRTSISASPQERKDIARRLGVSAVDGLDAVLALRRDRGKMLLHVEGHFRATVTQSCVVTLAPVTQEIENPVEGWFADPAHAVPLARVRHERDSRVSGAEVQLLDEKDDPEPVQDGKIDLGELVIQHLALALDPYPRAPDAPAEGESDTLSGPAEGPFAALKDWSGGGKE